LCYLVTHNGDRQTYALFPAILSLTISFTWTFSPGVYRNEMREGFGGALRSMQAAGVFRHPAVLTNGIELVVGEEEDAVAVVKEDIGYLDQENRSLVRYR
jgi:hypothetical protein